MPSTALEAELRLRMIGNAGSVADDVRSVVHYVEASDVDLLRDFDRVINLDAEIPDGAFDLRVTEQKLNRAKISGSPIDHHSLCASQ